MKRKLLLMRAFAIALLLISHLFWSFPVHAQQNSAVKGVVRGENNLPVANVSVNVSNGQTNFRTGTTTNSDGVFTVNLPPRAGYEFTFTYVGYEPHVISGYSVKSGEANTLDIELKIITSSMEDVVVIGYGTQKKKDVTGSVASVDLSIMKNSPNTNMGQLLQGTVPGLNVGVSTSAGGTPPISIRGQVTLNGNQAVLIILDGIQYSGSLSSINPDDIASIDILKDASATAVYGAQGANGVILITTRRGRTGKPRIAYSGSYSTNRPTVDLRPLNREQYLQRVTDAFWHQAYLAPDYIQPDPAFNLASKVDASMRDASGNLSPKDYDWWDNATNPGSIWENNLSFSGGNDYVNYLLSGSLVDQKNFIVNDLFKRKTIRANLEIKPFKFWKIGLVSSGSFVNQDGSEPNMSEIVRHAPLLVPFDTAGNLIPSPTNTVTFNPFRTYYVDDRDRNQYYFANIYSDLDIPFIKGLNYRVNFGNNLRNSQHYFSSKYDGGFTGRAYKQNQEYYDYTIDNILTYTKTFGLHNFTLTGLYGAIERKFSETFAEGVGFSRLNLSWNDISSASVQRINTDAWNEALNYQMGRLSYKYDEKYLLTATLRRDGFSGFAENFKYAIFPSIGLGWVISSESFMQKVNVVNLLKLRATYGSIGNQTGRYTSLARVETNSAYVFGDGGSTAFGQQVASLPNPNLKWERTQGLNLGIDFGILNNRLSGTLEYYNNNTYDLLYTVTVPSVTGFTGIQTNLGKIHNTGFEAAFTYRIVNRKDLSWSATYNFWTNKNEIVSLTGVDADGNGKEDDLVADGLFIGKSIGTIFNYEAGPIYQVNETPMTGFQTGSLRVVDHNKDNDITPADRVFLGNGLPKYRMSLFNTLSYKGFTFNFLLNSIQGGKDGYLANNIRLFFRDDNNIRDNDLDGVDYWSPHNPTGIHPRVVSGSNSKINPPKYFSRSFVRLQDVSLSYNLQPKVLQKIKAQAVSVFVSGKNLVTWTKWEGWDPETGQGLTVGGRPVMRSIAVGLSITY